VHLVCFIIGTRLTFWNFYNTWSYELQTRYYVLSENYLLKIKELNIYLMEFTVYLFKFILIIITSFMLPEVK
jgi:hypothetical protein